MTVKQRSHSMGRHQGACIGKKRQGETMMIEVGSVDSQAVIPSNSPAGEKRETPGGAVELPGHPIQAGFLDECRNNHGRDTGNHPGSP